MGRGGRSSDATALPSIKLVAVGDGAVGKTSLLISYAENRFPKSYVPTVFDNFETLRQFNDQDYLVCLWDTAGQEEYAHLRPISYPETDIFLVCFSLGSERSLLNLERWAKEIAEEAPGVPFMVVGNKRDLRESGNVSASVGELRERAERMGAIAYIECSAKEMDNVDFVFSQAVDHVLASGKKLALENPAEGRRSSAGTSATTKCSCTVM